MLLNIKTPPAAPGRERFLEAAAMAERAATSVGTQQEMADMMAVLRYKEELEIAMTNEALQQVRHNGGRQEERLPLREDGDDFGRIEARIPKELFFRMMKQKNFGYDGFTSDEGMRDFGKAFPQFMVKTITGKTQVGWREPRDEGRGTRGRIHFQRGTLQLAK